MSYHHIAMPPHQELPYQSDATLPHQQTPCQDSATSPAADAAESPTTPSYIPQFTSRRRTSHVRRVPSGITITVGGGGLPRITVSALSPRSERTPRRRHSASVWDDLRDDDGQPAKKGLSTRVRQWLTPSGAD